MNNTDKNSDNNISDTSDLVISWEWIVIDINVNHLIICTLAGVDLSAPGCPASD
jgi:hypothetical protein